MHTIYARCGSHDVHRSASDRSIVKAFTLFHFRAAKWRIICGTHVFDDYKIIAPPTLSSSLCICAVVLLRGCTEPWSRIAVIFSSMAEFPAACYFQAFYLGIKLVVFNILLWSGFPPFGLLKLWANCAAAAANETFYDYDASAYTQCEPYPAAPLYNGGILLNSYIDNGTNGWIGFGKVALLIHSDAKGAKYILTSNRQAAYQSPIERTKDVMQDAKYTLSAWVQIRGASLALVRATVAMDNVTSTCAGTVIARSGCWSFLKGGFVFGPDWPLLSSSLYFESDNADIDILVDSISLQPFTDDEWRLQQQERIATKRKRRVIVHVTDLHGNRLEDANVTITQKSRQFPFGSAIAKTILDNEEYQRWFLKRFNAAVFENELKWYATEPQPGNLNYSLADRLLAFCSANGISVRGHNIFWEDPKYTPSWVKSLNKTQLQKAVDSRIKSLVGRYAQNFISWDVSNEMLHFSFYEDRLGPDASDSFYHIAQRIDPWTPMFMNEFNVIETCQDSNSTVDSYIERLHEIIDSGKVMEGIGLESHFTTPNIPYMRAVLDKLGTLGLPIWLTEVDVSNTFDQQIQAAYLEEILREGFSHPAVQGILLWSALHPTGCYQMCLTDNNMQNLPAGDVVDRLLRDWTTPQLQGVTDHNGCFKFQGFLGHYRISASYGTKNVTATLSLSEGHGVQHVYVQI